MTLYETTAPYLQPNGKRIFLMADKFDRDKKPNHNTETILVPEFLALASSPNSELYSAIIISGIFGEKSFDLSNAILKKAVSLLADNGVLAVDIQPVEKMNINHLKSLLKDSEVVSNNSYISRQALSSALRQDFELLEFQDSCSNALPDVFVFRSCRNGMSAGSVQHSSEKESKKKRGVFSLLKALGGKNNIEREIEIISSDLRRVVSGKYIPARPRVVLLSPPIGLIEAVEACLNPKSISVFGESEWANIIDEPNGSAEFIFIGDMPNKFNETEYLKTLEEVARIRNRGGVVLIKEDVVTSSFAKTWPIDFTVWAKARNSKVGSRSILIGENKYTCISEAAPYNFLIRQDISKGEGEKAFQKFKSYTARNFFTPGEAARIVRLFSNIDDYSHMLVIYASHYGVSAAMRFGLIEVTHENIDSIDLIQALKNLISQAAQNEAIIFDLIGEIYRFLNDYKLARKFWVKSLFQTQEGDKNKKHVEALDRKIRLYLPCEIDCKTSKAIFTDPLLKNATPKNTVILAEPKVDKTSIESLVNRFDGELVFSPDFKGDTDNFSKTIFKPLTGLIPENSDLNKASHQYAETTSLEIIKALIASFEGIMKDWLSKHQISVALSIEDFLARHLLVLEAYAKAANANPQSDILLAGAELGYFDTSLNLLLSRLSHEKVWLQSDTPKSTLSAYQPTFEPKRAAAIKPSSPSGVSDVNAWFDTLFKIYSDNVSDYFSTQNIETDNRCYVLGNLAHRYFGESAVKLAEALYERGEAPIIVDSSTTRSAATDMSSLWEDCYVNEAAVSNIPVLGMLRPRVDDEKLIKGLDSLREHIQHVVEGLPLKYHGASASFAFSRLVARVLSRDIPVLLYNSIFAEKLISLSGNNYAAALSTREPHDHILADILKKNGIPITMVQCTDILRHPRYKKPVADQVTAIDYTALETFIDYLNIPRAAINVTGSPRSHINFHPERVKATRVLLDGRGLALNPHLRVLFATRTGNLDRIVECLDKVAAYIAQHPDIQLIVKTHPRETALRLNAYADVLKAHNIGGAANILDQGAAETLILISDCVISFPSNVVRVGAELGKPTLIYSPDEAASLDAIDSGRPHPLMALTLQEFIPQLEALVIAARKNKSSKTPAMDTGETLNRICEVIIKQRRSATPRNKTPRYKGTGARLYSSLSFRELSRLIKSQAQPSVDSPVDITLFERSLSLSGGKDDYISILQDLANYAPPTLQVAEFFAKLSEAAAGIDEFNEAIGALASEKFARYAAQLEYSESKLAPSTILTLAQSCLSVGQIEAGLSWYDFGKTQRSNARLRVRLENERNALDLRKWESGKEDTDYISPDVSRVLIVAERGTDPKIYTSMLPDDCEIDVYFDGKAGATLGASEEINSKSSRDVLDDRAPEIKGLIRQANALAKLIATQVLTQLKGSDYIGWLKDIRPAMEMEIRAGLITQLRRQAALTKAINGPYEAILFACNTPAFLALFSDTLNDSQIPTYVLGASQSPRRRHAFGAARRQGLEASREKQEDVLRALKKANTKQALADFDSYLEAISPRLSTHYNNKNSVIAVTSWRITTVKDGCLSLLESCPNDIPITIFDTSRHITDAKKFLVDINNYANQNNQDIRAFSAQHHNLPNPNLRELKNSSLAKSIFASVRGSNEGKALSHSLKLGVWNQIGTLLYKTLPMLYDLHIQVSTVCKQSSAASLILMPGRDAESLTAQNAVQKFDVKTTDVQTAYFSRQYIYTAPKGDIVTAMDEWSKDLFVEWFNLPEEKIHILGTSRFDRFSKLRMSQETQQKTAKIRPHICVATQPIQSDLTIEMLTYLNDLYVGGIDFDCTVKLHPRQSESIIKEIELIAHDLQKAGRLTITKTGDLAQILLSSDMVVTAYSNVAIEAALMDRPVLIVNFTGKDTTVPFVDFGIGEEARTKESFVALTKRILYDEAFGQEIQQKRHNYFKRYPSQWRGEAGKDTFALILENM